MKDIADELHCGRAQRIVLLAVSTGNGQRLDTLGNDRVAGKTPPSNGVPSGPEM